jgi:Zn-dependent protease with chaperone function
MAEIEALADRRVAALLAQYREVEADVIGAALSHERKRHAAELARLELRVDARLHEITKRQAIEADVGSR